MSTQFILFNYSIVFLLNECPWLNRKVGNMKVSTFICIYPKHISSVCTKHWWCKKFFKLMLSSTLCVETLGQRLYNFIKPKSYKNICKTIRPKYNQRCVASLPNWIPCGQLPSADPQWSAPAPGSGLRGHSHTTAGNSLSSARITSQQVYLLCFNSTEVKQSKFFFL